MALIERIVKFNSAHRVLSHLLFWTAATIIFLNRYDLVEYKEPEHIFYRHVYYMSFMILSSYFVAYLIIPAFIAGRSYLSILIFFLAGSYIICVASRATVVYLLEPLIRVPPFGQESLWDIMTDFPKLFVHYFAQTFSAAWVFALMKLIKDQYIVQQRSLVLEKEKVQSELNVLKAQLNPHFLFNTLNNIYSLSLINSPVTSKSIAGLSEILDHVLYKCNKKYVPISEEIRLINNYIDLEKLRYNDRLQVNFKYSIDEDAMVVPLVLLSLVENSFKHGAGENIGHPVIDIDLSLQGGNFYFRVSNGFLPEPGENKTDRIGLINIRKQLDLLYGDRYQLQVNTDDNIYVVLLGIHLNGNEVQ
ncbi:sensor histidine kinase [Chitinophaga sp. LS1]|uniref:sensor histidine kinase n=1 Tax=Chitinophaga sp. LS1 TaxID=3051176 RepID=UPI002AAA689A|nr:sensor histidine kinase [Chitinophaga sp. LS1]WPV68016.1 sensor histidine kinase [Chitinophaga sp. LS1]